jgi:hypothetical protein
MYVWTWRHIHRFALSYTYPIHNLCIEKIHNTCIMYMYIHVLCNVVKCFVYIPIYINIHMYDLARLGATWREIAPSRNTHLDALGRPKAGA